MSRLKNLKQRKNRIKVTACAMLLSLTICSTQGLGTYALFTDTENLVNGLTISTGDVDIELDSKHRNIISEFNGDSYTDQITITNNGTLKQNIKLNLNMVLGDGLKDEDWIESYNITFDSKVIKPVGNISYNQDIYLYDKNGELFELEPGKTINANIVIKTKNKELNETQKQQLSGKSLYLKLKIEAMQKDNKNIEGKGFYDIEVREDKFIIRPTIFGVEFHDDLGFREKIKINFIQYMDKPRNVKLISTSGGFKNSIPRTDIFYDGNSSIYIRSNIYNTAGDIGLGERWHGVSDKFNDGNHVILKFIYDKKSRFFKFDFKYKSKNQKKLDINIVELNESQVIAELNQIEIQNRKEEMKEPKEETEVPSKPEAMKEPKKETEVPSKSEVMEEPKEETEVPSKPEVMEEPKEETKVPSEPEVMEEPKKETEVPSKPEAMKEPKKETEVPSESEAMEEPK